MWQLFDLDVVAVKGLHLTGWPALFSKQLAYSLFHPTMASAALAKITQDIRAMHIDSAVVNLPTGSKVYMKPVQPGTSSEMRRCAFSHLSARLQKVQSTLATTVLHLRSGTRKYFRIGAHMVPLESLATVGTITTLPWPGPLTLAISQMSTSLILLFFIRLAVQLSVGLLERKGQLS